MSAKYPPGGASTCGANEPFRPRNRAVKWSADSSRNVQSSRCARVKIGNPNYNFRNVSEARFPTALGPRPSLSGEDGPSTFGEN